MFLDRLPRALSLRRAVAALLVVLAAVLAFRPSARDGTEPVLVAARALPAGTVLSPADVRTARMPPDLVPESAIADPAAVDAAVLAASAGPGEPITRTRLLGPEHTRLTAGPDRAAVPVRLADPAVARLLHPGARVDVVAAEPRSVVARDAVVLAVHSGETTRAGPRAGIVILALQGDSAAEVASISLEQPVGVTLR